jgi:hypothetical protein
MEIEFVSLRDYFEITVQKPIIKIGTIRLSLCKENRIYPARKFHKIRENFGPQHDLCSTVA